MVEAHRWVGGRVFTGTRYVEALLIEDGRVLVAGTGPEVARASPTGVETTRLEGRLVIPGLIDSHLHLSELVRQREGVVLEGTRSIAETIERVRVWSEHRPRGTIFGRGWDQDRFTDGRWPERRDLDRIAPDRPAILNRICGHVAWVNGAALERAGIDRATPDPPGGKIGRDATGEPDGLLYENALQLVEEVYRDALTVDSAALIPTLGEAVRSGLTTVASMRADRGELLALQELAQAKTLPVQVRLYLGSRHLSEIERDPEALRAAPSAAVRVIGIKAFADGSFGGRTALLEAPYEDAPTSSGIAVGSPEHLADVVRRSRALGLAPAIHAIGDRALARVLDAFETERTNPASPSRIEHASLTPPSSRVPLDRLRPALVVQPGFIASDWWLNERLGPSRARWAYAFRTLIERGHLLAGSSDAPFDSFDPWIGIRCAVRRSGADGRSANPTASEALGPEGAVVLYTVNGGRALGEPWLGELRAGARADFLVLRTPTLEAAIDASSPPVAETWSGGNRVA